jgi:tRNA A-37 threonylcarbamoyl transferase component Bud32
MSDLVSCPDCGSQYAPKQSLKGLCPSCLMVQLAEEGLGETAGTNPPRVPPGFRPPKIEELAPHFPKLEILELVGHGGMSAVYKARQKSLDRVVALKILPPEVAEIAGGAERFARETRTLARLSHPSIVALYDAGKAGPWCFCLMQFVEGPNLRQYLGDSNLSPGETLKLIPDICDGLQYAHDQGVVHRDIKPANILLDGHGRAKIADFGLAKLLHPVGSQTATATGQIVGTPHYIAPEQMERPGEIDHRADLYSLGVLLYEMLTGELPVGNFDPPSRKSGSDLRLDAVVLRSLAKDPQRRYQQARDVRNDLLSVASGEPKTFASPGKSVWERLSGLLRGVGRFSEFVLSGLSIFAAIIGGVMLNGVKDEFGQIRMLASGGKLDDGLRRELAYQDAGFGLALVCFCWLFSFVLARVSVGWSSRWRDLSMVQCLVTPILLVGYLVIGLVLPLVPALLICSMASVPLAADVEHWQMFGQLFGEAEGSSMLAGYWLSTFGTAALASAVWTILLATALWRWPRICRLVFHPAEGDTAKVLTLALAVFAIAVLLPTGCGLLYTARLVHLP